MKDGLVLVDKEPGGTSHDVVQKVRRLIGEKKVGHCGTLDPDATGLLLLTVGKATRLTRFLIRAPKVYEGTIRFGVATDTYDASGEVTAERDASGLEPEAVAAAMRELEGDLEQAVPPYSAKKVKGVKHYELARRGEEVPRETKSVTVWDFSPQGELRHLSEPSGRVEIDFRLACSSGTYARTLAHDLGEALGPGAHLASLRRTEVGGFDVADALTLDAMAIRLEAAAAEEPEVEAEEAAAAAPAEKREDGVPERPRRRPGPESLAPLEPAWVPFDAIPLPFDEVVTDAQQEQRIGHGQTVLLKELAGEEGDWVKLVNRRSQFIAVGSIVERIGAGGVGIVQPKVVFRG